MNVNPTGIVEISRADESVVVVPNKASLLKTVSERRVLAVTERAFEEFASMGAKATEIIDRHIKVLNEKSAELFGQWSEEDLQTYRQWQTSEVVQKIDQARKNGQIQNSRQLNEVLSATEMQLFATFEESHIGQLKKGIDAELIPLITKAIIELQETLIDPLAF